MPHDIGTKIGAIGSKVAHAAQDLGRRVRGEPLRSKSKKPLRPDRNVDKKRVNSLTRWKSNRLRLRSRGKFTTKNIAIQSPKTRRVARSPSLCTLSPIYSRAMIDLQGPIG